MHFRLLRALKTDLTAGAASRISAPAAGEHHREGRGALAENDASELVGAAVAEGVGTWGGLVQDLWEKATSQVTQQCTAMLQVCSRTTSYSP